MFVVKKDENFGKKYDNIILEILFQYLQKVKCNTFFLVS